ncbi:MAG: acyl carrier protein [Clostridia bacterium]|nr:acyl carrier protein [Clostridia bacterium]
MEKIVEVIRELNPYDDFDENTNLIEEGIIDSLRLVILINELEDVFDTKIPEAEIKPENFETVTAIWKLIERTKKIF